MQLHTFNICFIFSDVWPAGYFDRLFSIHVELRKDLLELLCFRLDNSSQGARIYNAANRKDFNRTGSRDCFSCCYSGIEWDFPYKIPRSIGNNECPFCVSRLPISYQLHKKKTNSFQQHKFYVFLGIGCYLLVRILYHSFNGTNNFISGVCLLPSWIPTVADKSLHRKYLPKL